MLVAAIGVHAPDGASKVVKSPWLVDDSGTVGHEGGLTFAATHPRSQADLVAAVGIYDIDRRALRFGVPVVLEDDAPAVGRPVGMEGLAGAVRDLLQVMAVLPDGVELDTASIVGSENDQTVRAGVGRVRRGARAYENDHGRDDWQ